MPDDEAALDERAQEQAHVELAYRSLDAMRERARRVLAQATADADTSAASDHIAVEAALVDRLRSVAESNAPLTFGRIDEPGLRYYIGRRHVEDGRGDPVVVDWRAPVAAPFYRATWADPLGLDLRRRFAMDGRTLVGFFDEDFTLAEGGDGASGAGGGVPDPLLIELERARTGEMRDIVATIQAEQDVVIRASLDELLIVQGGPGTGKTAVGLHRAAFLLYSHRLELERRKLLVVGPNPVFLDYIGHVLPSLGETAVVQATVERLLARQFPVRAEDTADVAIVKGDGRMAEVVARHVDSRRSIPKADAEVMTSFGMARFPVADIADLVDAVAARRLAANQARDVLRDRLVALAWQVRSQVPGVSQEQQFDFVDDLRTKAPFKKLLDTVWPAMSAGALVRGLLNNKRALAFAADGILGRDEQQAILRRSAAKASDERWTRADLGLLDEANALAAADHPVFGHVVVDEAQDLSAMELRMVARRAFGGSMTILGDVAQATRVGALLDWGTALVHLSHARPAQSAPGRVAELEIGYRVPAPVLEYANRLLPIAAPGVRPARSVRTTGEPPSVIDVRGGHAGGDDVLRDDVLRAVAGEADALARSWSTVGVLVPAAWVRAAGAALTASGREWHERLSEGITVLAGAMSKGLEFDAVVVAEPASIIDEVEPEAAGYRVLYVALTRAVQRLTVVHGQPLPKLLLGSDLSASSWSSP